MDVSVEQYGQYQGQNLYELTLTNDQGMVVKLLNYGATLEKVLLPEVDGLHNMVLSLPTREDYSKERNFLGGTVGRIVGKARTIFMAEMMGLIVKFTIFAPSKLQRRPVRALLLLIRPGTTVIPAILNCR